MAVDARPINELLLSITDAFVAANNAFPEEAQDLVPPEDGISLLDVKNDLLLSYLQHLAFLVLLRIRNGEDSLQPGKDVVKKLIELRAYLDRGVRPLEGRLRYQIDKVLRAADDAERVATRKTQINGVSKKDKSKKLKKGKHDDSDISASGSASEDNSDASSSDGHDTEAEEMAAKPNVAALASAARQQQAATAERQKTRSSRHEVYKPPRLNPVAMPDTASRSRENAEESRMARRRKNALLDEYINEEHSNAPAAQPSIGSNNTILAHGRQHTSLQSRDRDTERERREYEERNFTRLPSVSKAEKRKDKARQMRDQRDMFGGEDWTGLGGMGDRVGRSVDGRGGNRGSLLERREKRKRDTQDMPRGDGVGIGESFEKKRKVLQGRTERKRGGRR